MSKIQLINVEHKIAGNTSSTTKVPESIKPSFEGLGKEGLIKGLDAIASRNSADLSMSSNVVTTSKYKIPKWISDIYDKVDKNKKGVITKKDIDSLDRAKEGIGSIYRFEPGMTLESFVTKNKSVFNNYITIEGDPSVGREILVNGQLTKTNKTRNISLDNKDYTEVFQGEYCIASAKDTKYLQPPGVGLCVAVMIHDPISRKGFLTHIDTPNKAKSLRQLIYKLKYNNFDLKNCEASIIGGETGSSIDTIRIIKEIIENNDIKIKEMDVLGYQGRSIRLNLENGEVTDYDPMMIHSRKSSELDCAIMQTLVDNQLCEYKVPKK